MYCLCVRSVSDGLILRSKGFYHYDSMLCLHINIGLIFCVMTLWLKDYLLYNIHYDIIFCHFARQLFATAVTLNYLHDPKVGYIT